MWERAKRENEVSLPCFMLCFNFALCTACDMLSSVSLSLFLSLSQLVANFISMWLNACWHCTPTGGWANTPHWTTLWIHARPQRTPYSSPSPLDKTQLKRHLNHANFSYCVSKTLHWNSLATLARCALRVHSAPSVGIVNNLLWVAEMLLAWLLQCLSLSPCLLLSLCRIES